MLEIEFRSKQPHNTAWLHIEGTLDDFAKAENTLTTLKACGWAESNWNAPDFDGIRQRDFSKVGTELFNGWTAAEKKSNLATARRILKDGGFLPIFWHKMTLQEML